MIDRNIELTQININVFDIRIISSELQALYKKHGGWCHVKITKPVQPGTEAQNKAMHLLLTEYYKTNCHSAPEGCTKEMFKRYMKRQHGVYYEDYFTADKTITLKSWGDYTKEERRNFIDGLISEIHQSGAYVQSEKIQEIIEGMDKEGG